MEALRNSTVLDINLFWPLRHPTSPAEVREMWNIFQVVGIAVPGVLPHSILVERVYLTIGRITGYASFQLCESPLVLSIL